MTAVLLRKSTSFPKGETIPEHINSMIDLVNVVTRINEHLKGVKITQKSEPLGQWERFLLIEKIPEFVDRKLLIAKIKQIIN